MPNLRSEMAVKRDYYEVLGVGRNAVEDDIRRSYRKLARQYHPDVNKSPEAEERFKEVSEAYQVLSDAEKRRTYDQFGHEGPSGFAEGFAGFGFDEIFESFFGGARSTTRSRTERRGADLRLDLNLSFEEAAFGASREVEIPRLETCGHCDGSGAEPGSKREKCPNCTGTGEIRQVQQSIFGRFVNVTMCNRCKGEGVIVTSPCSKCRGNGRVRAARKLEVRVPPGVDSGQHLKLTGQGEAGPDRGKNGDLYVVLSVSPHPVLVRRGNDLIYDLTINVAQAALGDEVEVPTIDREPRPLQIPAGTQWGDTLRVRGLGVPYLNRAGRGDLITEVRIVTPKRLSDEQRKIFMMLGHTLGSNPDGESKGFFDKLKQALGSD